MKDKSKVLKTYRNKLQFICLIGGRVFNPRSAISKFYLLLPLVKNPPPN